MNPIDIPSSWANDVLPPEGQFNSRYELRVTINAWAAPRGYAFVVKRSRTTKNGTSEVVFSCDRGAGRAPSYSSEERVRNTITRRTACPFSVTAKESLCKTIWTLRHRSEPHFAQHNHSPSVSRVAHPVHRQLSHQDKSTVQQLANAGIAAKQIRSYLRDSSDTQATKQDIYNCIAKGKRDLTQGQSDIHALTSQLEDEGFWNRISLDETSRVTAVLFAHPQSLEILKSYPEVLILDCTYKTNKYNMPLLDIVEVDACQRSFCVACAFISGESEEDYTWAPS
jgi:hypothetical protein